MSNTNRVGQSFHLKGDCFGESRAVVVRSDASIDGVDPYFEMPHAGELGHELMDLETGKRFTLSDGDFQGLNMGRLAR